MRGPGGLGTSDHRIHRGSTTFASIRPAYPFKFATLVAVSPTPCDCQRHLSLRGDPLQGVCAEMVARRFQASRRRRVRAHCLGTSVATSRNLRDSKPAPLVPPQTAGRPPFPTRVARSNAQQRPVVDPEEKPPTTDSSRTLAKTRRPRRSSPRLDQRGEVHEIVAWVNGTPRLCPVASDRLEQIQGVCCCTHVSCV
jgi:hypothetical protein